MPLAFNFSYLGFLRFARLDIIHESMRPLSELFSEQWVCPQKFQILYKILLDAGQNKDVSQNFNVILPTEAANLVVTAPNVVVRTSSL